MNNIFQNLNTNNVKTVNIINRFKTLQIELLEDDYILFDDLKNNFLIVKEENEEEGTYFLKITSKSDSDYIFTPESFNNFKSQSFKHNDKKIAIYLFDKNETFYCIENSSFIVTNNFQEHIFSTKNKYIDYYFEKEFLHYDKNNKIMKMLLDNYVEKILKELFHTTNNPTKFYFNENKKTEIIDLNQILDFKNNELMDCIQVLNDIEIKILNSKNKYENIKFIKYFITIGNKEKISLKEILKIIGINFSKVITYIDDYKNGEMEKFIDKRRDFQKTFVDLHKNFLELKNNLQDKVTNLTFLILGSISTLLFLIFKTNSVVLGIYILFIFFFILHLFLKNIYFDQISKSKDEIIIFYDEISKDLRTLFPEKELEFYDNKKIEYSNNIDNYIKKINGYLEFLIILLILIIISIIVYKLYLLTNGNLFYVFYHFFS